MGGRGQSWYGQGRPLGGRSLEQVLCMWEAELTQEKVGEI